MGYDRRYRCYVPLLFSHQDIVFIPRRSSHAHDETSNRQSGEVSRGDPAVVNTLSRNGDRGPEVLKFTVTPFRSRRDDPWEVSIAVRSNAMGQASLAGDDNIRDLDPNRSRQS
jgi:hypothetical protein